jgi:predicted nucleic acid-binding protein
LGLTLDTGALIALERRDRRAVRLVGATKRRGLRVTVPTPVVVEWWRGQRGPVARLLEGLTVEPLDLALAKVAGEALGHETGPSVVDAVVMASAASRGDHVLTGDVDNFDRLRQVFPDVRVLGLRDRNG